MEQLQGRDLLGIADLSSEEIKNLLELAQQLKSGKLAPKCQKILGLSLIHI